MLGGASRSQPRLCRSSPSRSSARSPWQASTATSIVADCGWASSRVVEKFDVALEESKPAMDLLKADRGQDFSSRDTASREAKCCCCCCQDEKQQQRDYQLHGKYGDRPAQVPGAQESGPGVLDLNLSKPAYAPQRRTNLEADSLLVLDSRSKSEVYTVYLSRYCIERRCLCRTNSRLCAVVQ